MTVEADIAATIATFISDQANNTTCIIGYAIIGDMIIGDLGTGTNYGSNVFVDYKPPTPDNIVSVFGYAGQAPVHTTDHQELGKPSIQVWVRNTSAATARSQIESIMAELDGLANVTLGGTYYLGIFANQSPEPMGKDELGRSEFAVNFSVNYRR
jgi:hypothetical protein